MRRSSRVPSSILYALDIVNPLKPRPMSAYFASSVPMCSQCSAHSSSALRTDQSRKYRWQIQRGGETSDIRKLRRINTLAISMSDEPFSALTAHSGKSQVSSSQGMITSLSEPHNWSKLLDLYYASSKDFHPTVLQHRFADQRV